MKKLLFIVICLLTITGCSNQKLEENKTPNDTFLRLDGFKKGFVVINGFNLGRYYEIGPQKTLYVPAPVLKEGNNEIIVFDSHGLNSNVIEFFDKPDLG